MCQGQHQLCAGQKLPACAQDDDSIFSPFQILVVLEVDRVLASRVPQSEIRQVADFLPYKGVVESLGENRFPLAVVVCHEAPYGRKASFVCHTELTQNSRADVG
jgi:hypothetical protein